MTCVLCEAAPHEPCETYTVVSVKDPSTGKDGAVDVCLEHYEVIDRAL